jgi:hypothetical protein
LTARKGSTANPWESEAEARAALLAKNIDWRLRNDETGEVYPLGPMYRGTKEWTTRKLEAESLSYPWTLVSDSGGR